jgi:hypothetical protein
MPAQGYWLPQMLPNGAAMLVTNEIMAKRNIIVIMGTRLRLPVAVFDDISEISFMD